MIESPQHVVIFSTSFDFLMNEVSRQNELEISILVRLAILRLACYCHSQHGQITDTDMFHQVRHACSKPVCVRVHVRVCVCALMRKKMNWMIGSSAQRHRQGIQRLSGSAGARCKHTPYSACAHSQSVRQLRSARLLKNSKVILYFTGSVSRWPQESLGPSHFG